ncbi:XRN 5'-3' exonuclease N-terminus-domain-containing protein [Lasiosphaeria miniovina]|uniref:5'-3' exoribonuclease 1 n=1 Tax=Lasiosphaeria miniovina TaxID=1954250 RepID=A0AA40B574_9PEZI|nr:XRN 5'-3' exonuclease N-terminus-domain-containing protein [Lasiosphaeria miniovina]KAK0727930.1 XRN 5'-3' exonuclease N-terminus-domain-containing protein [Lasiosphaeria miniovina]
MNGIIHNCTHKDSDDVQFRLSEEEMFIAIFNYIEHLFGKIKPKKLFFMAIDGVAPRAKMNQQRARRFRTALDAERARDKAIREGKELPKEEPFDSNCITPGTEFMAKLSLQLKYFINKKVSEDREWQQPEIVLSGHEVPGEGEHKIMEYIRNARAQPDYNPNVRHCLYGLDADLIMLGLLSHDPHFCLLREEVTFGRQNKTKSKELEHQNFYLMHLCIVREYLELEFQDLKKDGTMSFQFDMEKVIDDFILMAFFVGNDFLPNLPRLHINEGALATMFRIYKQVLPRCDGYINEGGKVNLRRLGLLLNEIGKEEYRFFEHENEDAGWLRGKKMLDNDEAEKLRAKSKGKLIVTTSQKALWKQFLRKFLIGRSSPTLDLGTQLKAEDRKFVQDLADAAHISWATKEDDEGHRHLFLSLPETQDEDDEDEEAQSAVLRIAKKYDNAQVLDLTSADAQAAMESKYHQKFLEWKDKYYFDKFEDWTPENKEEELRKLTENYIQGLQWVLYYYYRGIASWPWFYRYHYSPMISDIMKGLNADLDFKLGQPFKPNEQLMGVLPDRSKKIVPTVYWDLMTDPKSPIIDFYPRDFELDMNGKKMEWEAVVKIPFIDEKRLLSAMGPKNELLSDDQKTRNDFGVALKFTYSDEMDYLYPSSLVDVFPPIPHCHCVENIFELPPVEGLQYRSGLTDGALLSVSALAGFPTLATLPYTATLGYHGVNVFQQDSRNESMVVNLLGTETRTKVGLAKTKLGQRCFVGYPFLQEAKIVRVSDELFDYVLAEDGSGQVVQVHHSHRDIEEWSKKADKIENFYSKRLGILISQVESLVHVQMLKGLVKTDEGATVKEYGEIPGMETDYASQIIVDEVVNEDERFIEQAALPLEQEFPIESTGFFLGDFNYGQPLEVSGYTDNGKLSIWLAISPREPEFARRIIQNSQRGNHYTPSYMVAKQLDLHPLTLSKITSSYFVRTVGDLRVNLGLNLKFEARKQKVLGYSRKSATGWEFSIAAVRLIIDYMTKFPDFFAGVKKNPSGNELSEKDLWSDPAVASTRVKEIGAWLKSLKTSSMDRVPLDAEQLDSDVVMQLASEADKLKLSEVQHKPTKMNSVPRNALMRPEDAEHRLGNQNFSLGDRVIYVARTGKVPIAYRGTVVGISRTPTAKLLDIVFDVTFMSGTTLGDRCPPFRGQTVPATVLLNLTDRQVVAGSKATLTRQPVSPSVTTLTAHGGYGGYGTPNGRHIRDAPAPAPLHGTWRGALNGSGNRGRGSPQSQPQRGSLNIMHSSLVYRPNPNQPQQQQQQQPQLNSQGHGQMNGGQGGRGRGGGAHSRGRGGFTQPSVTADPGTSIAGPQQPVAPAAYSAVPPPSNLDAARGRGRGRGRARGEGRGRGGGGRVRGGAANAAAPQQVPAPQS